MGAGVSQKTMNRYYDNFLKKYQRELAKAGITAQYGGLRLWYADPLEVGPAAKGFGMHYSTIRASNGETAGLLYIWIRYQGKTEEYKFPTLPSVGIERIKQLFGRTA